MKARPSLPPASVSSAVTGTSCRERSKTVGTAAPGRADSSNVAADVRRRISGGNRVPPPHVGGYGLFRALNWRCLPGASLLRFGDHEAGFVFAHQPQRHQPSLVLSLGGDLNGVFLRRRTSSGFHGHLNDRFLFVAVYQQLECHMATFS